MTTTAAATPSEAIHLPIGLWISPKAKYLKSVLEGAGAGDVDWSLMRHTLSNCLGIGDGVALSVADEGVDVGLLARRGKPVPDAPFLFEDFAAEMQAAAASAPGTVLPMVDAFRLLHGRQGRAVAPPTGVLMVASGPRAAVLDWYESALRALKVPGAAIVSKPGYKPSSKGPSANIAKGRMSDQMIEGIQRCTGVVYEKPALLLPMRATAAEPELAAA